MSVILTDMDMPDSCYECRLKTRCELAMANGWLGNKRDDNCPLKPYEERKGEWIRQTDDYHDYYECDNCGIAVGLDDIRNYCPRCGAKMKGGTE